jgi:mannosyl-3-phosphoglycerate phosphatase
MELVITDLDGTLLDRETHSFAGVAPALELLRRHGTPLVLCTSKTRVEAKYWRKSLENCDPFIVEDGGAVFVPETFLPRPIIVPAHSFPVYRSTRGEGAPGNRH